MATRETWQRTTVFWRLLSSDIAGHQGDSVRESSVLALSFAAVFVGNILGLRPESTTTPSHCGPALVSECELLMMDGAAFGVKLAALLLHETCLHVFVFFYMIYHR
jgi:hypothetical protein